jgi:cell division protein ZapA
MSHSPVSAQETPESSQSVSVDIYDQVYHLRGTDPAYIEHLSQVVDAKMRAVSALGGTVDSLRVAVLASLNIADELECLREQYAQLAGSITQSQSTMRSRSASLAGMLDEVLDETPGTPRVRRAG